MLECSQVPPLLLKLPHGSPLRAVTAEELGVRHPQNGYLCWVVWEAMLGKMGVQKPDWGLGSTREDFLPFLEDLTLERVGGQRQVPGKHSR